MLHGSDLARYARQIVLPELGTSGHERLRSASVLVVGAGGLGSPAALYLAAAGVGTLGILDDDVVEIGNLHRQILHGTQDVGRAKVASADARLRVLNPEVKVVAHRERLNTQNSAAILENYELVVDGSDNYSTRYAVNDGCASAGIPWIYGSVERFSGQVSVFGAPDGPCYRCLFPEPPEPGTTATCEEIGVLGAVPGVVGALQAVEALKWIAGIGEPLVGRLLQLDLLNGDSRTIKFERREDCPTCSKRERGEEVDLETDDADDFVDVQPDELAERLADTPDFGLLDVRDPWEWNVARLKDATLLPMNELPARIASLDRARELIVYCHHGTRSSMAADWLRSRGFRARSLAGGIDRWSREIDPTVPRY